MRIASNARAMNIHVFQIAVAGIPSKVIQTVICSIAVVMAGIQITLIDCRAKHLEHGAINA